MGELSDGYIVRKFLSYLFAKESNQKLILFFYLVLLNKAESSTTIKLNFATHLNLQGEISIRDLWDHKDNGVYNNR